MRCTCKMADQSVCGAPMEVRESTSEKNTGRQYYYCAVGCTGFPDVEHGFSHFVEERGPRFPKTEAKRVKEEQKRDGLALAQANPQAALDASALEGRLVALEHAVAEANELLRVLVARSNGGSSAAPPVPPEPMLPAKRAAPSPDDPDVVITKVIASPYGVTKVCRVMTDEEKFAQWKAQQAAMEQ